MKLESAMKYLREGKKIYRDGNEENYLKASFDKFEMVKFVYGSYFMNIFDVLADDWRVEDICNQGDL